MAQELAYKDVGALRGWEEWWVHSKYGETVGSEIDQVKKKVLLSLAASAQRHRGALHELGDVTPGGESQKGNNRGVTPRGGFFSQM